jgi:hypothetical protein
MQQKDDFRLTVGSSIIGEDLEKQISTFLRDTHRLEPEPGCHDTLVGEDPEMTRSSANGSMATDDQSSLDKRRDECC